MEKIGAARNDMELQLVGCELASGVALLARGVCCRSCQRGAMSQACLIRHIASIVQRCSKIHMLCCWLSTR